MCKYMYMYTCICNHYNLFSGYYSIMYQPTCTCTVIHAQPLIHVQFDTLYKIYVHVLHQYLTYY